MRKAYKRFVSLVVSLVGSHELRSPSGSKRNCGVRVSIARFYLCTVRVDKCSKETSFYFPKSKRGSGLEKPRKKMNHLFVSLGSHDLDMDPESIER